MSGISGNDTGRRGVHTDSAVPGARLAGRYRLVEQRANGVDTAYWRAIDEVLARQVGVRTLSRSSAHAAAVVAAARAAALVDDPRFVRVLDVSEDGDLAYVVDEWVHGDTLTHILHTEGPLPAAEAARIAGDVAAAVATAHARGLAHLALHPDNVLRTPAGEVKVVGLAVDAAAAGVPPGEHEAAAASDTQAIAALLYATLTGRWPGREAHGLPAAPEEHGRVCSPRQVRAGVPADLDAVTTRALAPLVVETGNHREPPVHDPATLAAALAATRPQEEVPAAPVEATRSPWPSRVASAARLAAACLLVGGLALVAGQIVRTLGADGATGSPTPSPTASPSATPTPDTDVVPIQAVRDFDPEGDGAEKSADADLAIDGDLRTTWRTDAYRSRELGRLKSGVGLVLDLGSPQPVRRVEVELRGRGTDIELRSADAPGRAADDFRPVAQVEGAGRSARLEPVAPVTARYLLVWLTGLPADDDPDDFRGSIAEVVVRR